MHKAVSNIVTHHHFLTKDKLIILYISFIVPSTHHSVPPYVALSHPPPHTLWTTQRIFTKLDMNTLPTESHHCPSDFAATISCFEIWMEIMAWDRDHKIAAFWINDEMHNFRNNFLLLVTVQYSNFNFSEIERDSWGALSWCMTSF
jgi:hypothetical protein